MTKNKNPKASKVYLVGSGISSLAAAVYLEKNAGVPGENIYILEQDDIAGGACDGSGDPENGFLIRGGRMHEKHYECYWDLLSNIPSLEDPKVSVKDESSISQIAKDNATKLAIKKALDDFLVAVIKREQKMKGKKPKEDNKLYGDSQESEEEESISDKQCNPSFRLFWRREREKERGKRRGKKPFLLSLLPGPLPPLSFLKAGYSG